MESDYNRYRKVNTDKEVKEWMNKESEDLDLDFWLFWEEVKAFADQYRLSTRYVEEEFLIDGELIPVHLTFPDDVTPD